MPEGASRFPARPSLEQLRKRAKDLLKQFHSGDATAAARLTAHKSTVTPANAALADAQFVLAREHGFPSWPRLKRHVELTQRPADYYAPTWGDSTWEFFTAVFEGDEDRVRAMIANDVTIVRAEYAYLQSLHYAVKGGRE